MPYQVPETITNVVPVAHERLRFHVQSRSAGKVSYLVDLLENGGFGACGCPDFQFRISPKLRHGEKPPRRCYHILRARDYVVDCVILRHLKK